jgi:urea transport system ATP-binding protein
MLLNGQTTEQRASSGIGYVPQGRFIFPQLTVEENLLLGCEVKHINLKKSKEIAYHYERGGLPCS